jgi:sugar phosphate isomerase/epimerase
MSHIARRQFLHSLTAAVTAPAVIRAQARPKRLPIAFSTLGCPNWEWKKILAQAAQMGYAAIELRGLLHEMDLAKCPEFGGGRLKQSLKDLNALGLRISDLGSSANLHEPDPAKRAAQMDEAKRFLDLAHQLGAPYVRVFPNKFVPGEEREVTLERVIAGLRELSEHAPGSGVGVILESHGDFTDSATLLEVLKGAARPNVNLLWDAHNMFVAHREDPAEVFTRLGGYVRHTHLKDSRPEGKGVRYVLLGTGAVPIRQVVRLLAAAGYRGYYCLEWEKRWHPEIEEPEVAFPHYAKVMREYLAEAGVKA